MLWKLFVDVKVQSGNRKELRNFFVETLGAKPGGLNFDGENCHYSVSHQGVCYLIDLAVTSSSSFTLEQVSKYLQDLQGQTKVKNLFKNCFIEVLDIDHGQKVKKFFEFIGFNVSSYGFNCTKTANDRCRYYGIDSEGLFDNQNSFFIEKSKSKIILLEEAYDLLAENFSLSSSFTVESSSTNEPDKISDFQIGDTVEFPVRKIAKEFDIEDQIYTKLPTRFHDNGSSRTYSNQGKVLDFCEVSGKTVVVVQFTDAHGKPSNAGWYPSQLKLVSSQLKPNKNGKTNNTSSSSINVQRPSATISTRERSAGIATTGRRSKSAITVGHLSYTEVIGS